MRFTRMAIAGASVCAILVAGMPPVHAAEEETAGNNLSVPLLWSETAYPPPLANPAAAQFTGVVSAGHLVAQDEASPACMGAVQKDAGNLWQADAAEAIGNSVTTLDWGDNLEAMDPNLKQSYTRVEVGLYSAIDPTATGYDMCWISGRGTDEVWGAQVTGSSGNWTAVTSERSEAMVYTAGARLTIQRIVAGREYTWDAAAKRWLGSGADAPLYNGALHEAAPDGPGSFGAEITVTGKLSYGYLWTTDGIPRGEYRLTFSLDGPMDGFVGSGTSLTTASILASEEESSEASSVEPRAAEGAGNTAVMRGDLNLSYLDVTVGVREDTPSDGTTPSTSDGTSTTTGTPSGAAVTPPAVGAVVTVVPPQAATTLIQQRAKIRARKAGTYKVGQTLLLTAKPVYTDAGVTVRWRVRDADRDRCRVRVRDGRATVTLNKPGTCTVIGWAPAPSPQFAAYQWTRTYRAVR